MSQAAGTTPPSLERSLLLKAAGGIAAVLALGWFAWVRATRVPLLGGVDLGFHELGHMLTRMFPEVVNYSMGSITQIAVPTGLALYFWWRKDWLGSGICLGWAGTAAQDASVYIADAPTQALQLIGGDHDWATVLGPAHLNILDRAGAIAMTVKGFGILLWLGGLALCACGPWIDTRRRGRAAAAAAIATGKTSPGPTGWSVVPPWEQDRPPGKG